MKCPGCGHPEDKVIDSRPVNDGASIRRRRECLACGRRFTTFETIEALPIIVVKRDGSKEPFDRQKLLIGVLKATNKRPVNAEDVVNNVEYELQSELCTEVDSRTIGEMVMKELRERDEVAYVRFVSVYREFDSVEAFLNELEELKKN